MCALRDNPCSVPGAPGRRLLALFHARHAQGMTLQQKRGNATEAGFIPFRAPLSHARAAARIGPCSVDWTPEIHGPMSSRKWYADGLHFECTQCGNCCSGPPGYVWVTKQDIKAIARHLGRKDESLGEPDDRIHKAAPGPDRQNFRSATPKGMARALYEANKHLVE